MTGFRQLMLAAFMAFALTYCSRAEPTAARTGAVAESDRADPRVPVELALGSAPATSVTVVNSSSGNAILGRIEFPMGGLSNPKGAGPLAVYVIRALPADEAALAQELEVAIGHAYLKNSEGEYLHIRAVDVAKSDQDIAAMFGVSK